MNDQTYHEELISANEAGKLLGISGKTVIRIMTDQGDFPGYRIGSYWKFKRGDILKYRESRRFQGGKDETSDNPDTIAVYQGCIGSKVA